MADDTSPSTVVFFPEGAFGPTNNCVGIANVLRQRGHRVVFVVEESFAGTLAAKGFEERLMRLQAPPEEPEEPGQFWKDFIRDTAPHFRKSTTEQLESLILPIWEQLVTGAIYVEERLGEIFTEVQPDVIVQDNVVAFPAVLAAGVPWVRIVSCNPLELPDAALPPVFSGLPTADQREWAAFRQTYSRLHADLHRAFDDFVQARGCPALPDDGFMVDSPYLTLYVYPEEADYARATSLPSTVHRLDSSVRTTDPPFAMPAQLAGDGKLIYVSLGSLGAAEPELMGRLVDLLGEHSTPRHHESRPAGWAAQTPGQYLWRGVPAPALDPAAGRRGDHPRRQQHDYGELLFRQADAGAAALLGPARQRAARRRARLRTPPGAIRLQRCGVPGCPGRRTELTKDARSRMSGMAQRLQANPGPVRAADLIERLAVEQEPIHRDA